MKVAQRQLWQRLFVGLVGALLLGGSGSNATLAQTNQLDSFLDVVDYSEECRLELWNTRDEDERFDLVFQDSFIGVTERSYRVDEDDNVRLEFAITELFDRELEETYFLYITTGRNDEDGGNHYGWIELRNSKDNPIVALVQDGWVQCL